MGEPPPLQEVEDDEPVEYTDEFEGIVEALLADDD